MDKETWMSTMDSFMDEFYKQTNEVIGAAVEEDEDRLVSSYMTLARGYSKIVMRMIKYQNLLEGFYERAEKESTKRFLEKALAPDDSDEVDGFLDIIKNSML